ncbi:hypothetical protein GCM10010442_31850 [Kitasatospora kifunensis]
MGFASPAPPGFRPAGVDSAALVAEAPDGLRRGPGGAPTTRPVKELEARLAINDTIGIPM